jgi:hypothetical protein
VTTKLIKLMGILAIILLFSSPALAADNRLQIVESAAGAINAAKKAPIQTHYLLKFPTMGWSRAAPTHPLSMHRRINIGTCTAQLIR